MRIDGTRLALVNVAALAVAVGACDKLPTTLPWSPAGEADAAVVEEDAVGVHRLKVLRDGAVTLSIKLGELSRKVRGEQPRVDDFLEGAPVVYEGVHLAALLDTLIGPDWVRGDHIRLRSQAGDATDVTPARLLARKSWLVWKRMDRPDFVVLHHGRAVPAGPLYLVWETGIESGLQAQSRDPDPWVHGIVSVDVVTRPAPAATSIALPADATAGAQAGFAHYRKYCAHCHTLAGVGANAGPELLRPVPVTEVWRPGYLERYLDDPTTIRLRATSPKLPADVQNRPEVIGDVVAFLHAVARAAPVMQPPATATPTR